MKNAVFYKNLWLMPKSDSLMLFNEWKKQTDPKLQQAARKKLDLHLKLMEVTYTKMTE